MEKLSSGDIFALLDSVESNAPGDIGNIMNGSDTEFAAEDELVIFTNMIRTEEIGDQCGSVSVPEASIHVFSTENEDETDALGQDEPNDAPATKRTSNHHLLLPLNVLLISHLLLLLLEVLLVSHPNLLLLLQLLYPKTRRNGSKAH